MHNAVLEKMHLNKDSIYLRYQRSNKTNPSHLIWVMHFHINTYQVNSARLFTWLIQSWTSINEAFSLIKVYFPRTTQGTFNYHHRQLRHLLHLWAGTFNPLLIYFIKLWNNCVHHTGIKLSFVIINGTQVKSKPRSPVLNPSHKINTCSCQDHQNIIG